MADAAWMDIVAKGKRRTAWTAADLLAYEFSPVIWIVPKIIPAGLTILAGAPKLGKSWLALSIGYAVSEGGAVLSKLHVKRREVLYLALEDTGRRLQDRLKKIGATGGDNFHIFLEWEKGAPGVQRIRIWLEENPDTKLVIIDTWGRFNKVSDSNDYGAVTNAAVELKSVCDEFEASILIIHHTNKRSDTGGDWMDSILGSTALNAAADTTLLLRRGRGKREATLMTTGRDISENEYVMSFNSDTGTWSLEGTTEEVQVSNARQEIRDWIAANGPASPKDVHAGMEAEGATRKATTVRRLLREMIDDRSLVCISSIYSIPTPETHEQHELTNSNDDEESVHVHGVHDNQPLEEEEIEIF